jgi:hypothetical protein
MPRSSSVNKGDFQLADDMATIKRGIETRVATIKGDLKQWLDDACDPADDTPISLALLETAFDRYLMTSRRPKPSR